MLVVGKVGYGLGENTNGLRETRLTPDEQYTHITLWTLVASNMLIGCDIAQMDDFTLNLLSNNEVNAIDQDILGKQADRVFKDESIEVWARPLADGSQAVGIFNVSEKDVTYTLDNSKFIIHNSQLINDNVNGNSPQTTNVLPIEGESEGVFQFSTVRDVWRQKNLSPDERTWTIPPHGCRYLKLTY